MLRQSTLFECVLLRVVGDTAALNMRRTDNIIAFHNGTLQVIKILRAPTANTAPQRKVISYLYKQISAHRFMIYFCSFSPQRKSEVAELAIKARLIIPAVQIYCRAGRNRAQIIYLI